MKQKLLLKTMLLLCALVVGSGNVWADYQLVYTLTPATGTNNSYTGNCDVEISSITWNISGNSQQIPWRLGGKSITTNTDRAVYSKTAMSSAITKVELKVGAASNITVNSLKLIVSSKSDFSTQIDEVSKTFVASSTITFTPTSPLTEWATGAYYKFVFNVTVSSTSNKFVEFTEAKFYTTASVAAPEFSVVSGTAVEKGTTVALSTSTEGASIYYTTDGNTPTKLSTAYSSPITLNEAVTIKAITIKGEDASSVSSASYTIKQVVAPVFSTAAGAVVAGTTTELSTTTEGATIYYTTDGKTPTTSSTPYTGAITINEAQTIKAIAVKENWKDSEVATAAYTLLSPVAGLSISFDDVSNVGQYTDWTMTNIGRHTSTITAHSGSYYGANVNSSNNGTSSASIQTKAKIAHPGTFTCYVSKESTNTSASTWTVQVSSDGSEWTDVKSQDAKSMDKGIWTGFTADLTAYYNVYVRLYYSGSTAIRAVDDISLTEATSATATIGDYQWATFVSAAPLDFSTAYGVKAYIVTGHTDKVLAVTQMEGTVPANTPLLLNAAKGNYSISFAESSSTDVSGNKLKAGTGAEVSYEEGKTKYVLSVKDYEKAAFKKIVDGTPATVAAGKAYLQFNETIDAPFMNIFFDEDAQTTGINDVRSKMAEGRAYYNLNGQRVAQPTKGLYIVNGKKVLVK